MSLKHVTAGTGFICENKPGGLALEPANQLIEVNLEGPYRTDKKGRDDSIAIGVGHRDRILVDIQADEKSSRLLHG